MVVREERACNCPPFEMDTNTSPATSAALEQIGFDLELSSRRFSQIVVL